MTEEKGPHCSLTETMLERNLQDAVKSHEKEMFSYRKFISKEEALKFWPDKKKLSPPEIRRSP
jgi:hypothetical protein